MIARRSVLALSLLALGRLASAGSYEDFFVAIQRDDGVTVESLLRRGFDPNTTDAKGQPGLCVAVQADSLRAAAALLRVSSSSYTGSESATTPAPACTYAVPSFISAVRI